MNLNFFQSSKDDPKLLEKYTRNLTKLSLQGKLDPVIGREEEIKKLVRVLSRRSKNNPVLVGEPGVGKTAIVEGLAFKIVKGDVPESLKDKEILELDLTALIAGSSFQGQFEEKIKAVIDRIVKSNGEIILFIDEIHNLIGAGRNQGALDAANILKPSMARGEIKVIGSTTIKEYKQYIEKDLALERRMQKIIVPESSVIDTINILRGIKDKYQSFHGVSIQDSALVAATELSSRYIQDRYLPDKAIDLLDEACALIKTQIQSMPDEVEILQTRVKKLKIEEAALKNEVDLKSRERLQEIKEELEIIEPSAKELLDQWEREKQKNQILKEKQNQLNDLNIQLEKATNEGRFEEAAKISNGSLPKLVEEIDTLIKNVKHSAIIKQEVTSENIADIISKWTGIPIESLVETEKEKLNSLEFDLHKYIKGQDEAVHLISNVIKKSRVGINDPNKPLGSFIFLGPTGVGKTELAKSLAKIMFNSEKEIIRFDMSEFSEKHSVSKLIGAPAGYIGYEEGGLLTDAVRRKPYSILLFDEIEKAHPDIFNIFLQILDDGRLSDNQGRVVNFKNTIIIMTSNVGTSLVAKESFTFQELLNQLLKYFRLEFINRVDEIIVFKPLQPNSIAQIVAKELDILMKRLRDKNYIVNYSQEVIAKIAKDAFDPIFGARPIKRYIAKNIETLITDAIIANDLKLEISMNILLNKEEKFVLKKPMVN